MIQHLTHNLNHERFLRTLRLGILFAALFHVTLLLLGQVRVDLAGIHVSCTGWRKPLLLLTALWGSQYVHLFRMEKGTPGRLRSFIERDIPWMVFLASLTLFTALSGDRIASLRLPVQEESRFLAGDEPSYMLLCQSVVLDGDVNLWNDARERGGETFHCPGAGPHKATLDKVRQRVYSIHSPGLAFLLSPFFAMALNLGIAPRFACVVALNLLAAGLCVLLYRFCRLLTGSLWASATASLLTAASSPLLIFASQIYPELAGSFLVLVAYYILFRPPPTKSHGGIGSKRPGQSPALQDTEATTASGNLEGRPPCRPPILSRLPACGGETLAALTVGACMGFLPWLHIRLGVFSLGILVALLAQRGRSLRFVLTALLPAAVSGGILMLCYTSWYGSPMPNAAYAAQGLPSTFQLAPLRLLTNLLGMALDNGVGLLPWTPFFAFVPAGLWFCLKDRPRATMLMAAPLLLYVVVVASFRDWFGGFCAANRFILVAIPFLTAWIACFLARNRRPALFALFAILAALAVFFVFRTAYGRFSQLYAKRHMLETLPLPHGDLLKTYFTPSILRNTPHAIIQGCFHLGLVLLLTLYAVLPLRRSDREYGGSST